MCWICILKLKRVQGPRVATKTRSHTFVNEVLQNVEIEIDQGRIFVRLLQATRVVRHWEAVDCVCEHRAEDSLSLPDLRLKDIHRPHWITAMRTKFHQEHLAADELVDLPTFAGVVIASSKLRPYVRLLFHIARHFDIGWIVGL